jgi:hypothetical protein
MTSEIKLRGGLSPSSITSVGTYEPWELQVGRGQIAFHKQVFKFGSNPDVNGSNETIWDAGGLYTYPSSALAMTVTSAAGTPADDNGVTVVISGLDEDYNEVSEEVTLAGSGTATTTQTFLRVFRAYVSGSQAPTGNLNITNGATTYARITLGENQTLMALWTVPAGYTAYILRGSLSVGTANTNQYVTGRLTAREFGGVFRTQQKVTIQTGFLDQEYPIPLEFPEKTDIEARAVSSGANNIVAATFNIIYIKNDTLS